MNTYIPTCLYFKKFWIFLYFLRIFFFDSLVESGFVCIKMWIFSKIYLHQKIAFSFTTWYIYVLEFQETHDFFSQKKFACRMRICIHWNSNIHRQDILSLSLHPILNVKGMKKTNVTEFAQLSPSFISSRHKKRETFGFFPSRKKRVSLSVSEYKLGWERSGRNEQDSSS